MRIKNRTKLKRISTELANELQRYAERNKKTIVEASKDFSNIVKRKRGKKVKYEIQF